MASTAVKTPRFDVVQFANDNCVALCTLLVIIALSFTGVGNAQMVCVLGLMLCVALLTRRSMKLDLWIFVPLLIYIVLSGYGSLRTYGTLTEGYVCVQAILLAVYLAVASMDEDEAHFLRRASVAWIVLAATIGIGIFVVAAFGGTVSRLGWPLGGANALGIFMVIGWFALLGLKGDGMVDRILRHGEPLVLVALALTLSLGSFGALVIGLVVMLLYAKRGRGWGAVLADAAVTIVKLVIGVGTGICLYLVPSWGDLPPFNVVTLVYLVALVAFWPRLEDFLRGHMRLTAPLAILGPLVAVAAALIRGSAPATFLERLDMIANGIGYLGLNPLFGVGPYQWRVLNMMDGDLYFNTWHIHNSLLHVAVELGVVAALMLLVIVVRFFVKRRDPAQRGAFVAFIVHNMLDTSFFFPVTASFLMVTAGSPRTTGALLYGAPVKLLAVMGALVFGALAACIAMGL
ncbi:MAG: hypothetical protein V8R08_05015 [Coriobacteriales bacterium]